MVIRAFGAILFTALTFFAAFSVGRSLASAHGIESQPARTAVYAPGIDAHGSSGIDLRVETPPAS